MEIKLGLENDGGVESDLHANDNDSEKHHGYYVHLWPIITRCR